MELKANPRKTQEQLQDGQMPAVAYNKEQNISFTLDRKEFDRAFRLQGQTGIFDITVGDSEAFPALVKSVQMDKRRRIPIHVDFTLVHYGEPIEVAVPIHTSGKARGAINGGMVDIVVHNLSVVAPGPRRIPQELVIDVTRLNIGDHVTAGQIKLPQGVTLAADADLIVVSVLPPRMSEGEAAAEDQAAQVAGLVAAGELSEEAAEAVLEGEATLEEVKAEESQSE
ncbi:50S ribosomal protein L25/general stress protein Ctc [Deinococcus ruber]|uniref:Large ribosomal subunit protein bL25 n=1 Tax=Deinococcus ruber TaxID=1848197 RepID=A0A918BYI4_9DEIO|nr:50S ribosomal protein L25/general stress protein Ctc [Deinococcus ruber]GGQ97057.1 50S ribosomal protein L25 [Deinococcus ruber]